MGAGVWAQPALRRARELTWARWLDREALLELLHAHQEELRSLAASHEDELRSLQAQLESHRQTLSQQDEQLRSSSEQIEHLKLVIEKLKRRMFGAKSDSTSALS